MRRSPALVTRLVPALLVGSLLIGCTGRPPGDTALPGQGGAGPTAASGEASADEATADPVPAPTVSPTLSPTPTPTPTPPACTPAPLERRAAAVLVVGLPHVASADQPLGQAVVDLGVGGLFLSEPNVQSKDGARALVAALRERAGRPLLVASDEESGRVAVNRDVLGGGPSPRRLARERTPQGVREYAAGVGARLADIGVTLDLAPLLDLDDGPYGGIIGDRSFSGDPEVATEYGMAFAAGLLDAGVTPTIKHFPGHGVSDADPHHAGAVAAGTLEELRQTHLVPFQHAIDAGAPVIMMSHLQYEALDVHMPASVSPAVYGLLRDMGFTGVAMTDSLGMGAISSRWDFPEAAVLAVQAGADAVLTTDGNQAAGMRDALVEAVRSGRIPQERLSEAAARVTALAGGDPMAMSCLPLTLPSMTFPALPAASP